MIINKITRYTTDKNGQPLKTKDGRPYTSIRIQVPEHGEKWVSGFGNPANESWKEGDDVQIEVVQKGEYLNFNMPKKGAVDTSAITKELNDIKYQLGIIVRTTQETYNLVNEQYGKNSDGTDLPDFDKVNEDSPF